MVFRFIGSSRHLFALSLLLLLPLFSCSSTPPSNGGENNENTDTTAPQLVDHTPKDAATDVLLADKITLLFSEPVDADSITSDTIKILEGASELGYDAELSSDAKTVYLKMVQSPASLPANLTVHVEGIEDLAGNSMAAMSFSYTTAADWVLLGDYLNEDENNDATNAVVACAPDGSIFVAYNYSYSSGRRARVQKWEAGSWNPVGDPFNSGSANGVIVHDLAIDNSNQPAVAWSELDSTNMGNVYVRYWNGTAWTGYAGGNELDTAVANDAGYPKIAFDGNEPVVVWSELSGGTYWVYLKAFDGSQWTIKDSPLNLGTSSGLYADIAVDPNGNYEVSWAEGPSSATLLYVKKWDGSSQMSQLGSSTLNIDATKSSLATSIAVYPSGDPVVAWIEYSSSVTNLYLKEWTGSSWQQLGAGGPLNANPTSSVSKASLAISGNDPVVAWSENRQVFVKAWNGSAWEQVGDNLAIGTGDIYSVSLTMDDNDNPVVAWSQLNGTTLHQTVYVKRFNGLAK